MIILGKNKVLKDYFIDENGVITDKNGVIQKTCINRGREKFKNTAVHKIMMYTYCGYRDGKIWDIHHIDTNKLNNKLENLVYLTKADHSKLHSIGRHLLEETKRKIGEANKGQIPWSKGKHFSEDHKRKLSESHKDNKNALGKHWKLSEETKRKMKDSQLGKIMVNNGIINKWTYPDEIPNGFVRGRL